ncbi:MAG: DUF4825 domain-containing protein [Lachnospiraceae bacterium]|nr:DUF4825 domain-containing protein [Lachnospiraceae bacterium]
MKEIIITSSVLILCIMLIRVIFRGKISSRLQYALWFLVALRLIVPSSAQIHMAIGSIEEFRIMDLVEALEERFGDVTEQLEQPARFTMSFNSPFAGQMAEFMLGEDMGLPSYAADGPTSVFLAGRIGASWLDILRGIWGGGMVIVTLWMIITNIIFSRRLHRDRKEFVLPEELESICYGKLSGRTGHGHAAKTGKIKFYITDYLTSSCLYGLPGREAIYLTPDITEDQNKLRHVVTHEMCHRKHGDSFWAILRSILLAVYWMNPLVWVAAVLSKRDCELACDEAALLILGEEERIPYGETLLSIINGKNKLSDIACTATTMKGSGKSVKERIRFIADKPRVLGAAVVAVLTLIMIISVAAFTKQPLFAGHTWEGEITLVTGDMQISLPETIAGISSYDTDGEGTDLIIYQVASGKEAGRFRELSYEEAVALMDSGSRIVPVGNYGLNPYLKSHIYSGHSYTAEGWTTHVYEPADGVPGTDINDDTTYMIDDGNSSTVTPAEESRDYLPNEQIITTENLEHVTMHQYTPAEEQTYGAPAHEDIFYTDEPDSANGVPGTDINDDTTYVIDDDGSSTATPAEESRDYLPNEQIIITENLEHVTMHQYMPAEEQTYGALAHEDIFYTDEPEQIATEGSRDYLPNEQIVTVSGAVGGFPQKCYVYVKADYSGIKEKYLSEMEFINAELETAAEQRIVVTAGQRFRTEICAALAGNRTEYLGNASKTGALVNTLPQTDGLTYKDITLHTLETEPETALSLDIRYEFPSENENMYMTDTDADLLFFNAAMLFATIKNLDECNFILERYESGTISGEKGGDEAVKPVSTGRLTYSRTELEEAVGTLWSDEAADSDESYARWLDDLYSRVADYLS